MTHRKQAMQFICKELTQRLKNPAPTLDAIFEGIDAAFWQNPRNQWFPRSTFRRVLDELRETTKHAYPER
jgi:hypothetical protein